MEHHVLLYIKSIEAAILKNKGNATVHISCSSTILELILPPKFANQLLLA